MSTRKKFLSSSRSVVNVPTFQPIDTPRILFLRPPVAYYEPTLQAPLEKALADAVATLPGRIRYELREKRRNADSGIVGGGTTRKGRRSEYLALRQGRAVDSARRFSKGNRFGADESCRTSPP